MSQWYYSDTQRNRLGPVGAGDLAQLHHAGQLQGDTLVWRQGLAQWQPWRAMMEEVLAAVASATAPAQAAPTPAAPLSAGVNPYELAEAEAPARDVEATPLSAGVNPYAMADGASPYAPPRAEVQSADGYVAGADVVYAGFWKRFAALFIDSLIVGVAYYAAIVLMAVAGFGLGGLAPDGSALGVGMIAMLAGVYILYPVISAAYYVGFEASSLQATPGKMAVGIKVTDGDGRRLGRARALGRWASHLLCYVTLYIGYIMAAFTDRKRGLHDLVAGTLVVDKWAWTAHAERQQRGIGTVAIVIIALAVLAAIAYIGVMAAIAIPAYQEYVQRAGG